MKKLVVTFVFMFFLSFFFILNGCVNQTLKTSYHEKKQILKEVKSEWGNAYFRGTPNNWGITHMSKIGPHTWQIIIKFNNGDGYGKPRFKIDHFGDWKESYPANDYEVEPYTTYKITFYDDTHYIKVEKYIKAVNGVMLQAFQWYLPEYNEKTKSGLWVELSKKIPDLALMGITALWLPPAYKGQAGKSDVGYGVYDLYDLGEFNQKGTISTKYGTKEQYLKLIENAHLYNIQVYGDIVFNHKMGADNTEWVNATKVSWNNRNIEIENKTIKAWTLFNFPGRNNKYSDFKWRWYHFDGVDWDQNTGEKAIFRFNGIGKAWDWEVDDENFNYDYLMGADLDMDHPEVVQELKKWGKWYVNFTKIDGFRLDAVKHIKFSFFNDWLDYMRNVLGKELFTVGEYWSTDINKLENYISKTEGRMSLFDVPLHQHFYEASNSGGYYDMRNIFNGTLVQKNPIKAVTFVENHDTQPGQSLSSPVQDWFKPLAYAMILLRKDGYPCVFYGDMYGAPGIKEQYGTIKKLIEARKLYSYGKQYDYLDHQDIIGWTRLGDEEHPKSMAVILSDGPGGSKWMYVGKKKTKFIDLLGNIKEEIWTNDYGWAEFKVNGGSVSVWVEE
ncbi:glycosidase [Marinitoga piezophila KA3]|uniref:Glycosidase n=1 Tax=Marinitoga piezophila (strain DSM 14283 / JCM 11233 / KA3) TaxID=443254 RepID=H2J5C6_MARPK|nr:MULTISPECIES: alpha-amylase [Marinitoga]AEX84984.1 glycosidase [Marinitoga piezophila KA3]